MATSVDLLPTFSTHSLIREPSLKHRTNVHHRHHLHHNQQLLHSWTQLSRLQTGTPTCDPFQKLVTQYYASYSSTPAFPSLPFCSAIPVLHFFHRNDFRWSVIFQSFIFSRPLGSSNADDDACGDRSTQTTLQYTVVFSEPCPAPTTSPDKCTQAVQTAYAPAAVPHCAAVLHRSVYSGWTPPDTTECPEKTASVEKSVSVQKSVSVEKSASVEPEETLSEPEPQQHPSVELVDAFSDSVAGVDCHIIDGVQQCRQHIEKIDREAACMEQLLGQLGCTSSPQRERVLDAVQKLDNLRCHINNTQRLLCNVEIMIHTCEQSQLAQQTGSETSRTELVQRELGRLNSRLCCTVLALERSMSKAISKGAQSGVVKLDHRCNSAMQQPCRQSEGPVSTKPVSTCTLRSLDTPGPCNWAYKQSSSTVSSESIRDVSDTRHKQPHASDEDGPQQQQQTDGSTSNVEQVSLEDIHRMLDSIISDIDHPAKTTTPGELDLTSTASLMKEPPGATPRDDDLASNASSRNEPGTSARDLEPGALPWDLDDASNTSLKERGSSARDLEPGASPRDFDVASNASSEKEPETSSRDVERGAAPRETGPWSRDVEPEASRKAGGVASTPSVMTDSVVASETSLQLPLEQTSPNNNYNTPPLHQQTGDDFDDDVMTQQTHGADEDCGMFHCPSVK